MMRPLKILLASCFLLFASSQAFALCATSPFQGKWKNVDALTRSLTKIEYAQACHDVIACPVGGSCSAPKDVGTIKVWGACSPSDCAWGAAKVYPKVSGDWVQYARYDQGFADKTIWLKKPVNGKMQAATFAQYKDGSGRPDKWTYDTFKK